jgi:hypothetical protein
LLVWVTRFDQRRELAGLLFRRTGRPRFVRDAAMSQRRRRARVRAALRAAAARLRGPFVCTALRADAERLAALRLRAAERACFDNALFDAALCPSRRKAFVIARERFADGRFFVAARPAFEARAADLRVFADVVPFFGGGSFTPARRAFERPIAIACFVDRAPCLPSRMWSISSRTNSPACVLAALPSRLSRWARSIVS